MKLAAIKPAGNWKEFKTLLVPDSTRTFVELYDHSCQWSNNEELQKNMPPLPRSLCVRVFNLAASERDRGSAGELRECIGRERDEDNEEHEIENKLT